LPPRARVLVVDDERFFREAIRDALLAAGIGCEASANGEEALRVARDPDIGAVVLDLGLPGVGGLEVLRKLRAEHPVVRVLVLAAQSDQRDVLEALRLGAADYLAKPLHDEELVLSVRRALDAHAVEMHWARLRGRVRALEARMAELAVEARDVEPGLRAEALAPSVAEALAQVLGAAKTSLMLLDAAAGELRVAAAVGRDLPLHELDVVLVGEGVAGRALASGESFVVSDVARDSRFGRPPLARYASPSFAVVPVEGTSRPLGVLCATDRVDGSAFGDDDLTLMRLLALQVGPLLSTPEAAARPAAAPAPAEAASDADAELMREVCEAITAEVEPERMFAAALRPVARALPAAPVALYLIDARSGDLALEQQVESGVGDRPRLPRGRGLCGSVLQTGWMVASDEPEKDARFDPEVDTPEDGVCGPLLCVPLRLRGKVMGLLRAFPRDGARASPRSGELLAAVFSAAVRSALLYRSLLESIDEVAAARRNQRGGA
jgi:DNA-binding response OmpR family regulator